MPRVRALATAAEPAPAAAADELRLEDLLRLQDLHDGRGWQYSVLDGDCEIGRLALTPGRWIWALRDGRSGYAPDRRAALAALARAWR